jgi:hypothetical protein
MAQNNDCVTTTRTRADREESLYVYYRQKNTRDLLLAGDEYGICPLRNSTVFSEFMKASQIPNAIEGVYRLNQRMI